MPPTPAFGPEHGPQHIGDTIDALDIDEGTRAGTRQNNIARLTRLKL